MNLGPQPNITHKNHFQMDYLFKCQNWQAKLLDENIGNIHYSFGVSKDFLFRT